VFSVIGELSGVHSGKNILSSDNQTLIFEPTLPFSLNEKVHVVMKVSGEENSVPLEYSFTVTSVSEEARGEALYKLHQLDEAEREAAMNSSSALSHNSSNPFSAQAGLPMYDDTVSFVPAVVVLDTVTTQTGEGPLFFSPSGKLPAPYAFLGILSDTASKSLPDSNNFIFMRRIFKPDGTGDSADINTGNFRMQPDGTLTYFKEIKKSPVGGTFFGQIEHLNPKYQMIDTFQCVGYLADLHDFQLLFNKTSILVAYDPQRVNMKTYLDTVQNGAYKSLVSKASDTAIVYGAIIQVLDENKQQVFLWRSWDHFQIVDATMDIDLTKPRIDYMHINAAISDPNDQNIIASFRHCDEVTKINFGTGDLMWRWGGKHNQFEFIGDTVKFSHQHDPDRIKNGHITMFDNGNLHLKDTTINGKDTAVVRPWSRAIEYDLDEVNHKATTVWQYRDLPYSAAAGNVQRFQNGNTLIGLGFVSQPSAIEITKDGARILALNMPNGAFSYRTYRFPWAQTSVRQTGVVSGFGIKSIYPNPVHSKTTINFSSEEFGVVHIVVSNLLGNRVLELNEKIEGPGSYAVDLELKDLPVGVYLCEVSQGSNKSSKMISIEK
ncbi:MAG: aryl-sulfate sulfotransferase, partial [Ignavibacteriota bacterium]